MLKTTDFTIYFHSQRKKNIHFVNKMGKKQTLKMVYSSRCMLNELQLWISIRVSCHFSDVQI